MALIRETTSAPEAMALMALVPGIGIIFGGLNSIFGNDIIALVYGLMLVGLCLDAPPPVRFWRRVAPVLALVGLAWVWALLSLTLGAPVAPDMAGSAMIGFCGMVAALLCGAILGARRVRLASFVNGLLVSGAASLVIGLIFLRGHDAPLAMWQGQNKGRFLGTLANANASGAAYGAMATLAFARMIWAATALACKSSRARAWVRPVGHGLFSLLFLAGLALTASRSGVALTILAFGLVLALAFWRAQTSVALLGLVLAALFASIVVGAGYSDGLFARFTTLPDEVVVRQELWSHNWIVARQAPWFGYGLGSFPEVNTRSMTGVRGPQALWMTNSPHQILLRLVIDAGVPFLLFILSGAAVIALQVAAAARRNGLAFEELGLFAVVLLVSGSAMVDIALEVPALAALVFGCAGLLWGRAVARH